MSDRGYADFIKGLGELASLDICHFAKDDVLEIETQDHTYSLRIVDTEKDLVEATSSGPDIKDPIIVRLRGSRITDATLWVRRIVVGYGLELGDLTLSPTKTVKINGVHALPSRKSVARLSKESYGR